MDTVIKTYSSIQAAEASTPATKEAGNKIDTTVKQIFSTCKLSPDADQAIHPLLADILAGSSSLKKGQLVTGKRKISAALTEYRRIFDHPTAH